MAYQNSSGINVTGIIKADGLGGFSGETVTQYNVIIGGASNALVSVAPSATSGVPLISQGNAANPTFGTAVVAGGGTGNTTFTAYSVICAGTTATGAFQNVSGLGSSGQVLTSNGAGALPTWQNATGGGLTWSVVASGTQTIAVNNGYVVGNGASLVTFTLPTTAAVGDTFIIMGRDAGGWKIAQGVGQQIVVGSNLSTSGITGYISSTNQYDNVTVICVTANTLFSVSAGAGVFEVI